MSFTKALFYVAEMSFHCEIIHQK